MLSLTLHIIGASAFLAKLVASAASREAKKYAVSGGIAEEVLTSIITVIAYNELEEEGAVKANLCKLLRHARPERPFIALGVISSTLEGFVFPIFSLCFSHSIDCFFIVGWQMTLLLMGGNEQKSTTYACLSRHLIGTNKFSGEFRWRFGLLQQISVGVACSTTFFLYAISYRFGAWLIIDSNLSPMNVLRLLFAIFYTAGSL
ncbi:hypothetical protein Q1695_007205 [Nippostrongylus brasiliensis]|nr:hypothetical protein Q1695_007205 [Nippostrongylus brasiliensis]